jgi:aryl-alcohol dehydrogenase-like predicted oxidoreductase
VARALELGINFFDTAPLYGNGASEENLGRVLKTLRPDIFLATKFTIRPEDRGRIGAAVAASLETSLRRLGRDSVDLLQLHNRIATEGSDRPLDPGVVIGEVAPALDKLGQQGKIRFAGITALGETPALHQVVDARVFDTAQVCYNLLNPSGGTSLPAGFPAQDFGLLLNRAAAAGMGTIGIRALAAGAMSGVEARHPHGLPSVAPIASGPDYRTDVDHAHLFAALVKAGHAESLVDAAFRFAISNPAMTVVEVGYSTLDHLEEAAKSAARGPLPPAALEEAARIWQGMAKS